MTRSARSFAWSLLLFGAASAAYARLLGTINARRILTSYSTDGTIPLGALLQSNVARGRVALFMQGYKRYRVSSQRFSAKPMNVEFVLAVDTHRPSDEKKGRACTAFSSPTPTSR